MRLPPPPLSVYFAEPRPRHPPIRFSPLAMLSPDLAHIRLFDVTPSLPKPLEPLLEVARNLWWTWHPEAVGLFRKLDPVLWESTHHNPVKMLGLISQDRLDQLARDPNVVTTLRRLQESLHRHLERTPWADTAEGVTGDVPKGKKGGKSGGPEGTIAYFCAEFGLTECLQIYSGGLGCLAGDHLKSASELGLNLVAVGLLYSNGYFQQYLNSDGWQQEFNPDLDFSTLPVEPVEGDHGQQVKVGVQMPGREVTIALWKVLVGRVTLYLLDTNLPENTPEDRTITGQLYGGGMEMRIQQELVLGIGGVRALEAVGVWPDVCHMNEGHSAFLALERIRRLIQMHDVGFDDARAAASAGHVFTTHTPVPAGIDRFPPSLLEKYFRDYVPGLKLDMEGLLALGRENVFNRDEQFSMAVLAIRTADWANGVSKLHGEVSRDMWQSIWPNLPEDEVPISHVTNGVHARSWLAPDLIRIFDRAWGGRWAENPTDQDVWNEVHDVSDEELWRVHQRRRSSLIVWVRKVLKKQLDSRGVNPRKAREQVEALDDQALTIGFARRFATYKRATLFLRDQARLLKLLSNADRPLQFLIAGKAHPADAGGKELIRAITKFAADSPAGHRIVFIENYDIGVARKLVQGCDVWMNTPRRGMEASGTSGMKAAINGGLNLSILDGWWDEGHDPSLGWAIGQREAYEDPGSGDDIESQSLYDLLENEIIPTFYDRDAAGLPRQWVERMKRCIAQLGPFFNTNRMVEHYARELYFPALQRARALNADGLKPAIELARQKERLRKGWTALSISDVQVDTDRDRGVREAIDVNVIAELGEFTPNDIRVEAVVGPVDNRGRLRAMHIQPLDHASHEGNGTHAFKGQVSPTTSGRHGLAIRIVPGGERFEPIREPGLIQWEGKRTRKTAEDVIAKTATGQGKTPSTDPRGEVLAEAKAEAEASDRGSE